MIATVETHAVLATTLCVAAAAAALLSGRALRDARADRLAVAGELPPMLAWWFRGACRMAPPLPARIPRALLRAVRRDLCRAGVVDAVGATEWIRGLLLLPLAGVVGAVIVAAWSGASHASVPWLASVAIAVAMQSWLRGRARLRTRELLRDFPAALELMVLCLEAGASIGAALHTTAQKSPAGPVRELFAAVLRQVRAGVPRPEAIRRVMTDHDLAAITGACTVLLQAESQGMALGPILRGQAAHQVAERFVRAERAALQAPVKLLLPLLTCIFPCTFIVIGVPIAARLAGVEAP